MKKILLILISAIVIFPGTIFGQNDKNGGSLYSIFGLGELSHSASTRTDAMGIMGFSLYGSYTNSFNPAAWTRIQSTIFSSKFNLENIKSTDGTNDAKRTYGNFESFSLSIPLNKGNGWILNLGLDNYSLVNYDTKFSSGIDGESYTQTYSGNGGLNRLNAGFSYIIFKDFSFGAQVNYLFGNTSRSLSIDFNNILLFDTKNKTEDKINGVYVNTGLIFHGFGKLFKSKKLNNLALGVFFSTPAKLNSSINGTYARSTSNTDSLLLAEGKIDLPWSIGAGISNIFNDKLTLAADFYFQDWDNYKYYGNHPNEIKNSMRIGAGLEYTASKKFEDSYYKRISLRLGGFYKADYLEIKGEPVNSYGVTAGLSLPIGRFNAVDLLGQYFIRGKSTNGLIKDEVFRFGATVRIGELWFLRPSDEF